MLLMTDKEASKASNTSHASHQQTRRVIIKVKWDTSQAHHRDRQSQQTINRNSSRSLQNI